jgi:hypothetical protein
MADVKTVGDRALWLEGGRAAALGETSLVVSRYMAAMTRKDEVYLTRGAGPVSPGSPVAERIRNIDHRHGNGRAEVIGMAVLNAAGDPMVMLEPRTRIMVRISVRAADRIAKPLIGFLVRNQLGLDFTGTDTTREDVEIGPIAAGDVYTLDFHLDLPELYPASFSFSPFIADGSVDAHDVCDWIDNALTLQMTRGEPQIYGYIHMPCRVEVNGRLLPHA